MRKKILQPHELSEDIKQILRNKFDNDFRIRSLNAQAQRHLQAGHYAEAMKIRQQIETLFVKVQVAYCQEAESQVEELTLDQAKVPVDDQKKINQLMVTLYMAVDIMDSCLLDINDTLHRTDKNLNYEKIRDLQEVAHLCKEQMAEFGKQAGYTKYPTWGDITDNMYEMMQKKAMSIIRKTEAKKK
jgi:uncharacterized Ntn-hydrolase superfamily protein